MISVFVNLLICVPTYCLSLERFHVHLRRMAIVLCWNGMFCLTLLSQSGLMFYLRPLFPYGKDFDFKVNRLADLGFPCGLAGKESVCNV